MNILIPLSLSFGPMIMWGMMDVFGGLIARKTPATVGFFASQVAGLLISFLFLPFIPMPHVVTIIPLFLIGILPVFSWLLYFKAAQITDISVVGPLSRVDFVITSVLGMIILHEAATPAKFISIVLVFAGGLLLSLNWSKFLHSKIPGFSKGALLALGSSAAVGLQLFFMAPESRVNGWFYTSLFLRIAVTAYAGISVLASKQTKALFAWGKLPWKLILGIGIVDFVGLSVYNFTVIHYAVSYVSVIVSCASLVTILIARVWLRERLRPLQYAGIILMILGIISLQMG